jgi:hypothetical protein
MYNDSTIWIERGIIVTPNPNFIHWMLSHGNTTTTQQTFNRIAIDKDPTLKDRLTPPTSVEVLSVQFKRVKQKKNRAHTSINVANTVVITLNMQLQGIDAAIHWFKKVHKKYPDLAIPHLDRKWIQTLR